MAAAPGADISTAAPSAVSNVTATAIDDARIVTRTAETTNLTARVVRSHRRTDGRKGARLLHRRGVRQLKTSSVRVAVGPELFPYDRVVWLTASDSGGIRS